MLNIDQNQPYVIVRRSHQARQAGAQPAGLPVPDASPHQHGQGHRQFKLQRPGADHRSTRDATASSCRAPTRSASRWTTARPGRCRAGNRAASPIRATCTWSTDLRTSTSRHRAVFTYVIDVPIGPGHRVLGWNNGSTARSSAAGRFPASRRCRAARRSRSTTAPTDFSGFNQFFDRPDVVGSGQAACRTIAIWTPRSTRRSSRRRPPTGRVGTSGPRSVLRTRPGQFRFRRRQELPAGTESAAAAIPGGLVQHLQSHELLQPDEQPEQRQFRQDHLDGGQRGGHRGRHDGRAWWAAARESCSFRCGLRSDRKTLPSELRYNRSCFWLLFSFLPRRGFPRMISPISGPRSR